MWVRLKTERQFSYSVRFLEFSENGIRTEYESRDLQKTRFVLTTNEEKWES